MITAVRNGAGGICGCGSREVRWQQRIHQAAWEKAGHDRWRTFVSANPELHLTAGDWHPKCLETLITPHRNCKHQRIHKGWLPLDHWHTAQTGYKEVVIVSQPYQVETRTLWVDGRGPVSIVDAGKDRSWYFPQHTHLVLIGQPSAIAKIDLTYNVNNCSQIPEGCRV